MRISLGSEQREGTHMGAAFDERRHGQKAPSLRPSEHRSKSAPRYFAESVIRITARNQPAQRSGVPQTENLPFSRTPLIRIESSFKKTAQTSAEGRSLPDFEEVRKMIIYLDTLTPSRPRWRGCQLTRGETAAARGAGGAADYAEETDSSCFSRRGSINLFKKHAIS